jgi:hypothetical protein
MKYLELEHSKVRLQQMKQLIIPHLNQIKLIQNKKKEVEIFGFKFNGLSELHDTFGIFLIFKNILINYFFHKNFKVY